MSIIKVSDPVWKDRQWEIEYTVYDLETGRYNQKVKFEALISLENYVKLLKEKVK